MSLLLPSLSNAELLESDLEDSRNREAVFDIENSELMEQLKEVGTCVQLNENAAVHEHTSGDLISELRKLKRAYETLCSNKDKEATEAVKKLKQNIEELQVVARKKDDEIGRLQAEASASISKILGLDGKLDEVHSLDKENDIQKFKVGNHETLKRKFASLSNIQSKEPGNSVVIIQENADHGVIAEDLRAELRKLKQAYETLSSNKDKESSVSFAVNDFLLNKLLRMDKDNAGLLKIKEVEAAQANEAAQRLQQNVQELQVAVQNKDGEIGRLQAEAGLLMIKQVDLAQKLQQNVDELQVVVRNKDNKISKLQEEAGILKKEEVEAVKKLKRSVEVLQVAIQNKDDENCGWREEATNAKEMLLTLVGKLLEMHSLVEEKNDEIQKLKYGQPESLKCKCASSIQAMKIKIQCDSKYYSLEVMESDHIYNVKAKFKEAVGSSIDTHIIEYKNKPLANSCALKELHIQEGAELVARGPPRYIIVKPASDKELRFFLDEHLSLHSTIYNIKEKISDVIGVPPVMQRLVTNGKELEDACALGEYNIVQPFGRALTLVFRLYRAVRIASK